MEGEEGDGEVGKGKREEKVLNGYGVMEKQGRRAAEK